ncbi:MAG: selenite/tellurite reduction operon porin ExtI [Cellvibrio sp.]
MNTIKSIIKRPLAIAIGVATLGATHAHAGPQIDFGEQSFLQINYALQVWAVTSSYTANNHDGSSTDVALRRNRITFSGQYNDYIGFYAQLEAGNDSKAGKDEKSVYYRDAYVTLDYTDAARFIIGRFKNTFSRENLEACLEPLTLDRGEISYTPFGGTRDTGVAIWGNLADAAFQYRVMIADGREGQYVPIKQPRITTRVHYSALDPEYDYGYRGTYLGTRKIFTIGAAFDYQADAAYADYNNREDIKDYTAWTVDAFWEYPFKHGTWTVSGAYFDYDLGEAITENPDPELPSNTQQEGAYGKVGYLFPKKVGPGRLQLFARHDGTEYNLVGGSLDRRVTTAGANYYLDGQRIKLSLEYRKNDYANPTPGVASLQDNHQTTLGFQFIL